jgi:hypothetical protein
LDQSKSLRFCFKELVLSNPRKKLNQAKDQFFNRLGWIDTSGHNARRRAYDKHIWADCQEPQGNFSKKTPEAPSGEDFQDTGMSRTLEIPE